MDLIDRLWEFSVRVSRLLEQIFDIASIALLGWATLKVLLLFSTVSQP